MAKGNKHAHLVQGIDEDPRQEHTPGTVMADSDVSQKPALTSEALRELFEAYSAADREVNEIKATVEAAMNRRSETVKAIVDALGNKGPWNINGARLSVVVRGDRYNMQRESDAKFTL